MNVIINLRTMQSRQIAASKDVRELTSLLRAIQ